MGLSTAPSKEAGRAPLALNSRRDTWWVRPVLTVIVLGGFGLYSLWRAFENQYFQAGPYLSPFYSPYLPIHLSLGGFVISPAIYILIFPLSFRLTCYYYRLAYYRAFFWDPPACAVPEPAIRKHYTGERHFPFVLQNLHRYRVLRGGDFHLHPVLGCDPGRSSLTGGSASAGVAADPRSTSCCWGCIPSPAIRGGT